MLDNTISNNDIFIECFSKKIYRIDYPCNKKRGWCMPVFCEGVNIKSRDDLETLQKLIAYEINIARKISILLHCIEAQVRIA